MLRFYNKDHVSLDRCIKSDKIDNVKYLYDKYQDFEEDTFAFMKDGDTFISTHDHTSTELISDDKFEDIISNLPMIPYELAKYIIVNHIKLLSSLDQYDFSGSKILKDDIELMWTKLSTTDLSNGFVFFDDKYSYNRIPHPVTKLINTDKVLSMNRLGMLLSSVSFIPRHNYAEKYNITEYDTKCINDWVYDGKGYNKMALAKHWLSLMDYQYDYHHNVLKEDK